jgi:hypothetical protein
VPAVGSDFRRVMRFLYVNASAKNLNKRRVWVIKRLHAERSVARERNEFRITCQQ